MKEGSADEQIPVKTRYAGNTRNSQLVRTVPGRCAGRALRDIVVNTISWRQQIADAELVAVDNEKGSAIGVFEKDISDATVASRDYFCCLSFFDDCHQSR
jgi:hypothetical protein